MKESKLRTLLAQYPAIKLFIKIFIDLAKADFFQAKNSLNGLYQTILCHLDRILKNKKNVECNFCNWKGNKFYPHVTTAGVMENEKCPVCHSIPRYRALMKFLINDYKLFDKKLKILEVGPNRSLQKILLSNTNYDYISVDLKAPQAMIHMDVTDLKFDDNCFDLVLCVGVMQYVNDDIKGFSEMHRVLKPEGELIFSSGINENAERTITYDSRVAANNFTVRIYGWDIKKILFKTGFSLEIYNPYNSSTKQEIKHYGISKHSILLLKK